MTQSSSLFDYGWQVLLVVAGKLALKELMYFVQYVEVGDHNILYGIRINCYKFDKESSWNYSFQLK